MHVNRISEILIKTNRDGIKGDRGIVEKAWAKTNLPFRRHSNVLENVRMTKWIIWKPTFKKRQGLFPAKEFVGAV
jgi:hypothetical protein